jgi:cobalamin synthase
MNLIAPLAALLGIEATALLARLKRNLMAYSAIGFFAAITILFLLIALFLALADEFGPLWASLIIAGGALVVALLIYATMQVQESRRKRAELERRRNSESSAFVTTAALTALPILMKSPLLRTVGIPLAIVAAVVFLARPSSRHPSDRDS